ncbi:G-type lectin S-receptor-like serine/threonine-protein kinase At4g27290 isoform X3 [Bidens hawaiensis]|uniref:G-type lectin S-receptor-like serine/threonine-protein kinase At4g27290 isoform X3 n=1 Tax=Bidens hawaiensis TaxID=980011 RepID=UPI00404AB901
MKGLTILLLFSGALCSILTTSIATDSLSPNELIRDGDTIVSSGGMFELGFFSPGNSKNRYLGIWYKSVSNGTVVWVANRDTPLNTTSGLLKLSNNGILQLVSLGNTNTTIWSSIFASPDNINNSIAQLLDNGNLVIRDENRTLWQSFDYPGDTYLPGMKIGKDLITGIDRQFTSWKSLDDPSPGQYVILMDTNGFPQIFQKRGSVFHTRFGPWNGVRFNGMPSLIQNPTAVNEFVINEKEIYYKIDVDSAVVSRIYINPEGGMKRMNWVDLTQDWFTFLVVAPADSCSQYGLCGPYGTCNTQNFPICSCLEGFEPKRPEEWNAGAWTSGCIPRTPFDCGNESENGFRRVSGVKFPDTRSSWYNFSMNLEDCEKECRSNCSCTAYANIDIRNGGSGCLLWFNELVDVREYNETQDLYIRMDRSELTSLATHDSASNKKKTTITAVVSTSICMLVVGLTLVMYLRIKKKRAYMKRQGMVNEYLNEDSVYGGPKEDIDLPSFSLSTIAKSTSNFSITNKLGQGGFGSVYKGVLGDGREIAVKRLSKSSRQGLDEFKNEVRCIAKLQHRNLVKLLGYCIQGDETMLIYEYMANKSLDLTIFDTSRSSMLDWPKRFHIILGIARGLLYLHQDSRLRVIHRDLKAANILLDDDMNPKISDFGLARRFKGYETEANTNKVVGTYGYIAPEYAVHGLFSIKSDVFSFGVLVLEIVSGQKSRGFSHEQHGDSLLGHAWRLYKEDRSIELASSQLRETCADSEIVRSIHIGLLCVQHHAEDRPTMSSVVVMLDNESTLPPPKQPAFFTEVSLTETSALSSTPVDNSNNNVTITVLEAR